jgi:glycosyltransferase involved in cell wall biosynthesis
VSSLEQVGVVVIGRNEGENLRRCLESLAGTGVPVVYVDSGSTDGSMEVAAPSCAVTLALDPARPFSAARARNEGFSALLARFPGLQHVQFVDGDCTILPGWLHAASTALAERPELALVFGHLQERHPEASVYNLLCSLEWRSRPGAVVGHAGTVGIMMVRAGVFKSLGGFKESLVAGEDPEFAVRVRLSGGSLAKLDVPMATHDAHILAFAQWWKRALRAGHGIGQRYDENGTSRLRDCARELRSTVFWAYVLPVLAIVGTVVDWRAAALWLLYPALYAKVFLARARGGDSLYEAHVYSLFILVSKIANGLGLLLYLYRKRKKSIRLIEYR